jgi:DNA invertase Pin-like site-specific DNA recombinase
VTPGCRSAIHGQPEDNGPKSAEIVVHTGREVTAKTRLERQKEGIAKAKGDGKYKGRAPTALRKADQVKALHAAGIGATEIAAKLGMGRASVYRALAGGNGATLVQP